MKPTSNIKLNQVSRAQLHNYYGIFQVLMVRLYVSVSFIFVKIYTELLDGKTLSK
jgi:hypothetical protein